VLEPAQAGGSPDPDGTIPARAKPPHHIVRESLFRRPGGDAPVLEAIDPTADSPQPDGTGRVLHTREGKVIRQAVARREPGQLPLLNRNSPVLLPTHRFPSRSSKRRSMNLSASSLRKASA